MFFGQTMYSFCRSYMNCQAAFTSAACVVLMADRPFCQSPFGSSAPAVSDVIKPSSVFWRSAASATNPDRAITQPTSGNTTANPSRIQNWYFAIFFNCSMIAPHLSVSGVCFEFTYSSTTQENGGHCCPLNGKPRSRELLSE